MSGTRNCASCSKQGEDYGRSEMGKGEKVNVEYVSANPTGPMHVGHGRGAVFGDALANLLAFTGYKVTREYYINDAGAQVDVLARSAYLRYREALGENIRNPRRPLSRRISQAGRRGARAERTGHRCQDKPEAEWLPIVRKRAIDMMMDGDPQRSRGAQRGQDVFFSERSLIEERRAIRSRETIDWLRKRRGLRGPSAAAERRRGRGLGRSRADIVPLDRISATMSTGR